MIALALLACALLLYVQAGCTLWLWLTVTGTRPLLRLVVLWLPAFWWKNWDGSEDSAR